MLTASIVNFKTNKWYDSYDMLNDFSMSEVIFFQVTIF